MNLIIEFWQLAAGLVTGVMSGLIVHRLVYPAGRGKIISPGNRSAVGHRVKVSGTFRAYWFKRRFYLYLVLRPVKAARHYPQVHSGPITPDQRGEWVAEAYVGLPDEKGDTFTISLVAFDSEARKIVDYYQECAEKHKHDYVGFHDLPVGTRVLDAVTVIR